MTKQKHFFLFRGLIREAKHWGDFPEMLKASHSDVLVSTIDIPGAGVYYRSPSPLSVKNMVKHMRREYLKLRLPHQECIILAISLGGMIAAQWLRDYPEDFQKTILVNTSYGGLSPVFDRLKPSALLHLLKVPLLKGRAKEAHILKLISNNESVFEETLNLWEQIQKERPVSLGNTIRQLSAGGLFRIGEFKPSVPVLILAGSADRMVSVNCSRHIAQKWDVPLYEHPTAGHDLSSDAPEWMIEKIKHFLT